MHTIEIPTLQNVAILYELGGVCHRWLSAAVDLIAVLLGYVLVCVVALILLPDWVDVFRLFLYGLVAAYVGYHVLFDMYNAGQTPGRWLMGTRVVRLDGRPISWGDALIRALLLLVDGPFSAGLIGTLLIQTTPRMQRLGDVVARTTVICEQAKRPISLLDVLRISTVENYAVTYPQVRLLTEADMLVVKATLVRLSRYPNEAHRIAAIQLAKHLTDALSLPAPPPSQASIFLETLLRDYVILTR